MKSLADFTKKSKVAEANITRDKFYRNEVYKKGEWVITEQGQVGKIHRRGPNYVLCLTAENTKFRSWIKDIKEVFEIGTDAYREYVMSITPGQKVAKPSNTVKVKETIPSKHPLNKMDKHEEKTLAQLAAENLNNPKAFNYNRFDETWRYDYSAKVGNTDIKGLGADGVGGGDAPGMKMAEAPGTEGKPKVKKVKHSCATKVEHAEWGKGNTLKEMHTLDEEGNITHYDVMFEHGLEQDVPVPTLNILVSEMHEHVINDEKNEVIEGKKAKKDYDGDGKIESGKDEYFGSRDKAIKKAMGKKAMMKKEHHQKDADGKVIEHDELEEGKKGLYANIHAKRKRGEAPAKPGDKDYPAKDAFKKAAKTAKKEEVEVETESMAQARKNVGASTCWTGYKAKGTKMKGGKKVPNCVKEFSEWRKIAEKK